MYPIQMDKTTVTIALARGCTTGALPRRSADLSHEDCEWARSAIEVLNEHSLAELIHQDSVHDRHVYMVDVILCAIQLATDPESCVYSIGPHPALVLRIIEAIVDLPSREDQKVLTGRLASFAKRTAQAYKRTSFGMLWRAVAVACHQPLYLSDYSATDPVVTAEHCYYRLKTGNHPDACVLREFLKANGADVNAPSDADIARGFTLGEVLVVVQQQSELSVDVAYGSKRIIREVAKYLQKTGIPLAVTGISKNCLGVIEGLVYFGFQEEKAVPGGVRDFGTIEAVLCVSRGDVVPVARARRVLIYQHGPHRIESLHVPYSFLNAFKIRIACLSASSAREQVSYGMNPRLVSFVYSAYDKRVLYGKKMHRDERALIFAGGVIDYKGVDIAIRAFEILKAEFPQATFHVYGNNGGVWHKSQGACLRDQWVGSDGHLDFRQIAKDVPGLVFHGEAGTDELAGAYRRASLLVMPSRVAETFGLVSIEAQACGCIPVLPRRGAFPETMKDGATGYLYDGETPQDLARAISNLWHSGKPTEEQREAATRFVAGRFDWNRTGGEVLRLLIAMPRRSFVFRSAMHMIWYVCVLLHYHGSLWGLIKAAQRKARSRIISRVPDRILR